MKTRFVYNVLDRLFLFQVSSFLSVLKIRILNLILITEVYFHTFSSSICTIAGSAISGSKDVWPQRARGHLDAAESADLRIPCMYWNSLWCNCVVSVRPRMQLSSRVRSHRLLSVTATHTHLAHVNTQSCVCAVPFYTNPNLVQLSIFVGNRSMISL